MNVKMTFTIPESLAKRLRDSVADRKRSAFVATVLEEKLESMDKSELERRLARDYAETRDEDFLINQEFESAALEVWPEH